ncbi:MAG TPA: alpha/beta hydrolase [Nitrososphaeraceae archaeon]|nr:alpha/beta hydrolase [Nitrososphaeraceae archaeon]
MNEIDLEKYKLPKNEYKLINVNGHTILYSESKNKDKKHVLFIHGLGASSFGWRDIPDALSEQFHTISLDLIGFGGSDKPQEADYTIKGFSKFIVDFLRAIELEHEKITAIVGHSLGGYIALQFAIENKNLIEKLVLIDSSGKLNGPTTLLKQYLDAAMGYRIERFAPLKYENLKGVFEKMYFRSSTLHPIVLGTFLDTIEEPYAKHAFKSAFDNSTGNRLRTEDLEKIKDIPCLILWGDSDNLIPLDEYSLEFLHDLPRAKLEIIRDSGHAPFVEKTALVYERIRTFIT